MGVGVIGALLCALGRGAGRSALPDTAGSYRAPTSEPAARLEELLARLPALHREVLVLRMSGLSADAAARAVGSTPDEVRIVQHAALNGLRAQLSQVRPRRCKRRWMCRSGPVST